MDNLSPMAPPEVESPSPWEWLRANLFSTWYNVILTIICLLVLVLGLKTLLTWIFTQAQWEVIEANFRLFFVGRYPPELYWRLWTSLGIIAEIGGLSWGFSQKHSRLWNRPLLFALGAAIAAIVFFPIGLTSRLWLLAVVVVAAIGYGVGRQLPLNLGSWLPVTWVISFLVILWFIKGGLGLGLEETSTNVWNGLLLTLLTAIISITLSFPIGVLLALGRQSTLPVVRWFCILYIEIIRGLPLIGILFFALTMLQLFLPPEYPRLDQMVRAIAGLTLFSAAYLAENVRGGLQSVPRGQAEAARALGLNPALVVILIVLPQALKAVIPAIVGQFISLFKDTSLLAIFGLLELLGMARSILAQPQFLGRYAEVYLFVGLIYWVFCYGMSLASRRLERKLNVGQR
ncbi:MAG: amino acid ABC transporter permease [Coleofasciculus sp. S288]|nr:amino acid ABC transporter permease [Coleofasciculus sp. S288]